MYIKFNLKIDYEITLIALLLIIIVGETHHCVVTCKGFPNASVFVTVNVVIFYGHKKKVHNINNIIFHHGAIMYLV